LHGRASDRSGGYRGDLVIACVGAGQWGRNVIRNFHDLGVLSYVCDPEPEARARISADHPGVRVTASLVELLEDPQVEGIAIASPASTHGSIVRSALMAGKHVLVEKPLCLSVSEGRELVALASAKGRILMVGHLLWYHPAVLKLKEFVDNGCLGRMQYIYSNRLHLGRFRQEENILWSFAPHDISVILGLVGELPDSVSAHGGSYLHNQIVDVTVSALSFPSGVKAHVFVSWLHPFKEQKLVVVGDRAMAVFDDVEKKDKLLLYPHSIDWRNHVPVASRAEAQPVEVEWAEPLRAECLHFLECIRTGTRPRTDGEEGLRVLSVLQRCQEALGAVPPVAATNADAPPVGRSYFAHETAVIDEGAEIGEGTTIWHFSHVLKDSRVGKQCRIGQNVVVGPNVAVGNGVKIQNNVSVYEGVTLEDHVFCGPSVVFTNVFNPRSEIRRMEELRPTLVRRGASLGANCTILCGVTIGEYAFVGAGAVVTHDVPDYALVHGNPGRVRGWMCRCGVKLEFRRNRPRTTCSACGAPYARDRRGVRSSEAVHS
jgi:UDP-2-acetamido-3-amino-2,3-dideoxy-glucuronate N-acetyltransferase